MVNSEKVKKLSEFCYEISQTEHDVFFSYHPNIDSVSIVVYKGGWKKAILGPVCSLPILEEYWRMDNLSVSRTKKVIVELLDVEKPQNKNGWFSKLKSIKLKDWFKKTEEKLIFKFFINSLDTEISYKEKNSWLTKEDLEWLNKK